MEEGKEIAKEWRRLMKAAKQLGYGRMEIVITNGKPVMIDVAVQHLKLDGPEDDTDKLKAIII